MENIVILVSMSKNLIVQKDGETGQVLRMTAQVVNVASLPNETIADDLKKMHTTLATQHDGVALAAPQIGISKRIFVVAPIIFKDAPDKAQLVFINPVITKISSDKKKMDEGCLSVRGLYGQVRRATRATVEAFDENGQKFEMTGSGLLAQIFQHEIDHLDGILFVDKATDLRDVEYEG